MIIAEAGHVTVALQPAEASTAPASGKGSGNGVDMGGHDEDDEHSEDEHGDSMDKTATKAVTPDSTPLLNRTASAGCTECRGHAFDRFPCSTAGDSLRRLFDHYH